MFLSQPSLFKKPVNSSTDSPSLHETEPSDPVQSLMKFVPSIIHNSTPECVFSSAQPGGDQFDVQVCIGQQGIIIRTSCKGVAMGGKETLLTVLAG